MEKDMIDELEQQQAFEEALKDDHEKLRARIAELEAAALKYLAGEGQRCEQIEAAQKRAWNAALEAACGGISGASPWGFTQSKALEIVRTLRKGGEDE